MKFIFLIFLCQLVASLGWSRSTEFSCPSQSQASAHQVVRKAGFLTFRVYQTKIKQGPNQGQKLCTVTINVPPQGSKKTRQNVWKSTNQVNTTTSQLSRYFVLREDGYVFVNDRIGPGTVDNKAQSLILLPRQKGFKVIHDPVKGRLEVKFGNGESMEFDTLSGEMVKFSAGEITTKKIRVNLEPTLDVISVNKPGVSLIDFGVKRTEAPETNFDGRYKVFGLKGAECSPANGHLYKKYRAPNGDMLGVEVIYSMNPKDPEDQVLKRELVRICQKKGYWKNPQSKKKNRKLRAKKSPEELARQKHILKILKGELPPNTPFPGAK